MSRSSTLGCCATGSGGASEFGGPDIGSTHRRRRVRALRRSRHPFDEDAREPHLERVLLTIAGDVRKHFQERILNRLIGVVRVAQVVVRDSHRSSLLPGHQIREAIPRRVAITGEHERLDAGGELRFPGRRRLDSWRRSRHAGRHRSLLESWLRDASRRRSHGNTAAEKACLPRQRLTFSPDNTITRNGQ